MTRSLFNGISKAINIEELKHVLDDCTIKIGFFGGRYIVCNNFKNFGRNVSVNSVIKALYRLSKKDTTTEYPANFLTVLNWIDRENQIGKNLLSRSNFLKRKLTRLKKWCGSGSFQRSIMITSLKIIFSNTTSLRPNIEQEVPALLNPQVRPPLNPVEQNEALAVDQHVQEQNQINELYSSLKGSYGLYGLTTIEKMYWCLQQMRLLLVYNIESKQFTVLDSAGIDKRSLEAAFARCFYRGWRPKVLFQVDPSGNRLVELQPI